MVAVIVGGAAVLILGAGCSRALAARFRSAAAMEIEKVKSLFQLGANVNATDGLGYSGLIDVEA